MKNLTEATKREIRETIAAGDKTGRWNQTGGNGRGRRREWTTKDGIEIGVGRDPEDGEIRAWTLADGNEISAEIGIRA
jgi:hypothetical protein